MVAINWFQDAIITVKDTLIFLNFSSKFPNLYFSHLVVKLVSTERKLSGKSLSQQMI